MPSNDTFGNTFDFLNNISSHGTAIGICFCKGTPIKKFFSYPADFLKTYEEKNLARHDPTLDFGFTENGTISWRELREMHPNNLALNTAHSFGIRDGICIAMTIEGKKTIASISQDPDNPISDNLLKEASDRLALASIEAAKSTQTMTLSQRTLEYLELAARGMKEQEMINATGLSIHGVRARRTAALREIGAKTPAQAVTIAIANDAMSPYAFV